MSGKTITKEEFLNAVAILKANAIKTKVVANYEQDDFYNEDEECTNCGYCDDCDDYVGEDENDAQGTPDTTYQEETEDIDIIAMEELLDMDDYTFWKEFVYDLIEEGYGDIPSWKIADFVNDEFNTVVSARTIAAVKASANR